jgi:hypothetical protein
VSFRSAGSSSWRSLRGFEVGCSASLARYYVHTLDCFVENLKQALPQARAVASAEVVERRIRFYGDCAYLRRGTNDMFEFTMVAR